MVSAASIAFRIASSVACTVAEKIGLIRSLGSISTRTTSALRAAFAFAVENATKMSPELFSPLPPMRPTASADLVTTRCS